MFEVDVNGLTQQYRTKPTMNVDITGSSGSIPKNLNVVFSGINNSTPDSCNVTYDELRSWIKNGVPVFAAYKVKQDDGSVLSVGNIVAFMIRTNELTFYYETGASMAGFIYKSDGTFSGIKS